VTLVSTSTDEARNVALLQAVGADRLNPAQRELFLSIANRYSLDPLLKHLVMIEGRAYITRDGLLHVAHASGQLDGIETTEPTLDDDGKFWRSKASVFRKDMSRAFTYGGRYPADGRNAKYAPEMAVKVAEVMALRRAFDVAAATYEERWDEADPNVVDQVSTAPASLTDRIAARAETVAPTRAGVDQPESTETVEGESTDVTEHEGHPGPMIGVEAPVGVDVIVPGQFPGVPVVEEPSDVSLLGGPTLEEFGELMKDVPKPRIRRIAKRLFPDASKFANLTPTQLQAIVDQVIEADVEELQEEPAPAPSAVEQCGMESPYGTGLVCSQDKGHPSTVPHRAGLRETW